MITPKVDLGNKLLKKRYQIKSKFYYIFWGIATASVVGGQFYVGSGYRRMSESLDAWFLKTIQIMIQNRIELEDRQPEKPEYSMPVL
tara:strand:- start:4455 stop:4715 length:261 start_codon:yes stop_codon:yes gene_type:complete